MSNKSKIALILLASFQIFGCSPAELSRDEAEDIIRQGRGYPNSVTVDFLIGRFRTGWLSQSWFTSLKKNHDELNSSGLATIKSNNQNNFKHVVSINLNESALKFVESAGDVTEDYDVILKKSFKRQRVKLITHTCDISKVTGIRYINEEKNNAVVEYMEECKATPFGALSEYKDSTQAAASKSVKMTMYDDGWRMEGADIRSPKNNSDAKIVLLNTEGIESNNSGRLSILNYIIECAPMHETQKCTIDEFRRLIRSGADVNEQTKQSNTPLRQSLISNLGLAYINELIDNGAKVSGHGLAPIADLVASADFSSPESQEAFLKKFKLLVKSGAQVDAVNSSGLTAIMLAARANKPELVEVLFVAGADPHLKARSGQSAYESVEASLKSYSEPLKPGTLPWYIENQKVIVTKYERLLEILRK